MSLQERLQEAVADTYRIEKELGGGGMSRVFLAEETALGRQVVIKVLPPEMGAGVNLDRFHREIQVSAKLQHPHVVSVLTAGSSGDLVYYVMPYIEGESLRSRIARESGMPVADVIEILREVVDALSYSHSKQVVHRDIKPDNILLSGRHALVADFGVAKAVAASSGDSTLTSLGMALGTPTYMSPEQAAADPNTDHRADIYSVGIVAYEMLSGSPPFSAPTPQAMLAAHFNEQPEPVDRYRSSIPAALTELVMRCLQKHPADRWQSADELRSQLEAIATPSGGTTPFQTAPVSAATGAFSTDMRAHHPVSAGALYGVVALGLLGGAYGITIGLGLPMWVFGIAAVLTMVGFPIIITTGVMEQRRAELQATRVTASPVMQSGVRGLFTWGKAIRGGVAAFAVLAVLAIGFMATRVLGVGPGATLLSAGVLESGAPIVLAEFENRTTDSALGATITEALRVDLAQSPVVSLLGSSDVRSALERMNRGLNDIITGQLALEIAEREGAGAVVVGEIGSLGSSYVLSARLLAAGSGDELVVLRETAGDDSEIINAVDRLSAGLRERIGESLRTIRATQPLEQVTTSSLEALRLYTEGALASDRGDGTRAIPLLQEAIAADTNFAMAYRKLAVARSNTGFFGRAVIDPATRAYQLRDRLPEQERLHAIAYYQTNVEGGFPAAIQTYRRLLERYPDDEIAPINLAFGLNETRRYAEAEQAVLPMIAAGEAGSNWFHYLGSLMLQGRGDEAESLVVEREAEFRGAPPALRIGVASIPLVNERYDEGLAIIDRLLAEPGDNPFLEIFASFARASWQLHRGQARAAADAFARVATTFDQFGQSGQYFGALDAVISARLLAGERDAALALLDSALAARPLSEFDALDRPYTVIISALVRLGELERATDLWSEYVAHVPDNFREIDNWSYRARGDLDFANGDYETALANFRTNFERSGTCGFCGANRLGRTFEALGQPDSAIAAYEHVNRVGLPGVFTANVSSRAEAYRSLGRLYEERGDIERAVANYNSFVNIWDEADPVLQPQVREVRERIAELVGETR